MGERENVVTGRALRRRHQSYFIHYGKFNNNRCHESTPNGVNVFEKGLMLPDHSELKLSVAPSCWLQIHRVFQGSGSK